MEDTFTFLWLFVREMNATGQNGGIETFLGLRDKLDLWMGAPIGQVKGCKFLTSGSSTFHGRPGDA